MRKAAPPKIPGLTFVQPLGSGGYADVYLYEQQRPRMPVAVKVLRGEGLTDSLREQLSDEADTMAQLGDHPYIVQVFRSGTSDDGRPYLVMKYYPGDNLAKRARAERFTVEEVLRTGIQLASAVETAHRARITHRDIKPANVLVSAYGAPGLTDFGIAGAAGTAAERDSPDGVGVSVPWAPPEVLYGQSNGDERSDVYSLAATLWQLLVGRSPFEEPGGDNSAYALMPRIRSNPVPTTGRPDVPAGLERLLAQAMAKEPTHRQASALELARGLQAVEQQQRLARTPVVVLDEQGHTTLLGQLTGSASLDPADDDRTRIKSPQTVHAQPAAPVGPSPAGPSATDPDERTLPRPPQGREAGPALVPAVAAAPGSLRSSAVTDPVSSLTAPLHPGADESTVRRALAPPAADVAPAGAPRPGGRLLVGLGAVVTVLAILVVLLLLRPSEPEAPSASSRPSPTVGMPGDDSAIGNAVFEAPVLEAESGPGRVVFTWSYAAPLASDRYVLHAGPTSAAAQQATPIQVRERTHTVLVPAGTEVCALVKVNRSGQASPTSEPKCESAR